MLIKLTTGQWIPVDARQSPNVTTNDVIIWLDRRQKATTIAGVNFTNISQAAFSNERVLHSFSLIKVWLCNFLAQKLLVNGWWNWPQKGDQDRKFSEFLSSLGQKRKPTSISETGSSSSDSENQYQGSGNSNLSRDSWHTVKKNPDASKSKTSDSSRRDSEATIRDFESSIRKMGTKLSPIRKPSIKIDETPKPARTQPLLREKGKSEFLVSISFSQPTGRDPQTGHGKFLEIIEISPNRWKINKNYFKSTILDEKLPFKSNFVDGERSKIKLNELWKGTAFLLLSKNCRL